MTIATPEDTQRVGEIVGEAFINDPVSAWTMGSPTAVRHTFATLGRALYMPYGHCCIDDDCAATMWLWPNQSKALPLPTMVSLAWTLRQGLSFRHAWRAIGVDAAMSERRPAFPHMYLFAVGVLDKARGRGLGGKIIRESLSIADEMGLPSYLENSNPKNTGLYQRLGFQAVETFDPMPGCPPITTMLRPPTA